MSIKNNLYFSVLFFSFLLNSCHQKESTKKNEFVDVEKYVRVSNENSGGEYQSVYQKANDSISFWTENNLSVYYTEKINKWKIDSLICFNEISDKCLMAILKSNTYFKDQTSDGITYFYGVKINQKWYFFKGPYLALPRESNSRSIPRTFSQLHAIAMKEVFRGYLKKNANGPSHGGEWEINERFFDDLTSGAWYNSKEFIPKTQADWDKIYLKIVAENWKNKAK